MDFIIITGLSGAGKSTVIHAMEDIGYFCVDNLPVKLIPDLVHSVSSDIMKEKLAVVTDVRAGLTPQDMNETLEKLKKSGVGYKILFIDCKEDVILNRFKLSRRTHPLSDECISIEDAVAIEKKLMMPFKEISDYVIDTSMLHQNSCKNRIFDFFSELEGVYDSMVNIHCVSFGFKHGVPQDADYIFDVRSLPNPYYIDELKELTGLDEKVSGFVMSFPEATEFKNRLFNFSDFIVPLCIKDGRSQLVIAVGCTGGHHRSVTFAELLHSHLKKQNYKVSVSHRDINK